MTDTSILAERASTAPAVPFNSHHLDALLEAAGIDILIVTRSITFNICLAAIASSSSISSTRSGIARYLPILLYRKGRPEDAIYIGNAMEDSEAENGQFWCPKVETKSWGTLDATNLAIEHIERLGGRAGAIGVEFSFIPADAMDALRAGLPDCRFVDGHLSLERLRAVKSPKELELVREASERRGGLDAGHLRRLPSRTDQARGDGRACDRRNAIGR